MKALSDLIRCAAHCEGLLHMLRGNTLPAALARLERIATLATRELAFIADDFGERLAIEQEGCKGEPVNRNRKATLTPNR